MKKFLLIITFLCTMATHAQSPWRTDFRHSGDTLSAATMHETLPAAQRAMTTVLDNGLGVYGQSARGTVASIGAPRIPVIMVAFSDLDFLPEDDETKISRWLGEEGYSDETYAVGSVADYFRDNSYGLFTPTFEVVARVTLSQPLAYYGAHSGSANDVRPQQLVREAIELAIAQGVDFSGFATDGSLPIVSIIHAGPGEQEDYGYRYPGQSSDDYIWAHYRAFNFQTGGMDFSSYIIMNEAMRYFDAEGRVTSQTLTGIGTFCHEFCHALGLPDIYDVNGATSGAGHTPGFWDVMDYQFMLNGYRPGCLSAYERCCLGWLDIPELPLDESGIVSLLPLDGPTATEGYRALRITNPANENEYFILENRQAAPWHVDSYGSTLVLGTGMLVWHIDYSAFSWSSNTVNANASHQRVSVVPADGTWQQPVYGNTDHSGDLFPGAADVTTLDGSRLSYYTAAFEPTLHSITQEEDGSITFSLARTTSVNSPSAVSPSAPVTVIDSRTGAPWGISIKNHKKHIIQ